MIIDVNFLIIDDVVDSETEFSMSQLTNDDISDLISEKPKKRKRKLRVRIKKGNLGTIRHEESSLAGGIQRNPRDSLKSARGYASMQKSEEFSSTGTR